MSDNPEIGKYLRLMRRKKRLSQEKLGELAGGISRQRICDLEGNKIEPYALELVRLSNTLGKTPDYFLQDYLNPPETPVTVVAGWEKLRNSCTPGEQQFLLSVCQFIMNYINRIQGGHENNEV